MKKLLLLICLLPFFAHSQTWVNGTIQRLSTTGEIRYIQSSFIDSLVRLQKNSLSNLDMLRYNSATGKFIPRTPAEVLSDIAAQGTATRTTVGNSFYTLTNPSAITFPRINADNTVSALDAASFRTAIGAGTSTVTPAALTKTDDTNVTLTLGGTPSTALLQATSLTLGWTGTLAASRGGTGISSLGTGVATALGVNVGSAGAFVVNGGALGTPSSGNLANTTGLPRSSITGLGTGVSSALGISVGSSGGMIVGDGNAQLASLTMTGTLAMGSNNITSTGSLGATGARLTKGWFTDLEVTNAIAGSITGSAATLTTTRTIFGQNFNGSANVSGAASGITTLTLSGEITSTATGEVFGALSGGTSSVFHRMQNTGSDFYIGIDNSTGGIFGGGNYAANIYNASATNLNLWTNGVKALSINSSQNATFAGTLGIGGTADNVKGGTYTPTITNGTNISTSTPQLSHYTRTGDEVTVTVAFDATYSGSGGTNLEVSLPISSNLTSVYDLHGSGVQNSNQPTNGIYVLGDTTNDRAQLFYNVPATGTNLGGNITFMYTVK